MNHTFVYEHVSAFSSKLPDAIQEIGLWLGIILIAWDLVALIGRTWEFQSPLVRKAGAPISPGPCTAGSGTKKPPPSSKGGNF